MRRIPAILAGLLMAAALSPAWASDEGGQGKSDENKDRGGAFETQVQVDVRLITVKTTDLRQLKFDWVVVSDGQSTVAADAGKGVSQENQDRIDLSFIPFLSSVTRDRYTSDDVSARTRIGSAWNLGNVLFVALNGGRLDILSQPRIAVLNSKFVFVMKTPALPIDWQAQQELESIGELPPFRDLATPNASTPEARRILIAGMDTPDKVAAAGRVPVLGDIPALGRLFLGGAHQRNDNEVVIFIRPSIIVPDE
jgi:type II/III secretion system protein